ncbi:MAG: diaminopimelate decarboxylase [Bacteroidia bacterium]|nr:diaminopimelate decarboxylase [Bacteroidia bacterium]
MILQNGRYVIQGVDVEHLALQYGTPLYVYDASVITRQVQALRSAFSRLPVRILYAMKALSTPAILELLRQTGVGIDAVSIQEVELALRAGYQPKDILFTPNGVGFEEIKRAIELGVRLNIDNIPMLERFGEMYGHTVPCCIRLNPHINAGGHAKISTGHIDSKFGISILQLRHLTRIIQLWNLRVNGLHIHTGSDILDTEVFLQGVRLLFDIARDFPDLEFIDLGSGFKVAYRSDDVTTDLKSLAEGLEEAYHTFTAESGRTIELWFEPGKFIVSEAGVLLVRVNVVKPTPATVFVGVNSGFNHLIRPMMYDAYHEIVNVSRPEGPKRIYTVVGYLCETDTFGSDRLIVEVREGDILGIRNAGAYGYTMSSNYNSRPRPAELLIYHGKPLLIRRAETLEDMLRTVVSVDWNAVGALQEPQVQLEASDARPS